MHTHNDGGGGYCFSKEMMDSPKNDGIALAHAGPLGLALA